MRSNVRSFLMQGPEGQIVRVKEGFSFTALFFGFWVLFHRGMILQGFLWLALMFLTYGVSGFVLMFIINKLHKRWLEKKGYRVVTQYLEEYLE